MVSDDHYEKTKRYFDLIALEKKGFYDAIFKETLKHNLLQLRIRKKVLQIFKSLRTKNNLDMGCGNGDFTIELAKTYPNLTFEGIDFSEGAVRIAKDSSKNFRNVKFGVGDVLSVKFKNGSFDTVFCINTLHHVKPEDLKIALRRLSRISKENIILEVKNGDAFYYKCITCFGLFPLKNHKGLEIYSTNVKIVKNILRDSGFELVKTIPLGYFSFLSPLLVLYFKKKQTGKFY